MERSTARTGDTHERRFAGIGLVAAFAILLLPVLYDLAVDFWWAGLSGQAPIVLCAAAFAIWSNRPDPSFLIDTGERRLVQGLYVVALLLFLGCKAQQFIQGESLLLLLAFPAIVIAIGGKALYRKLIFFQFLMLLALPLPFTIADSLLVPLKIVISQSVVHVLASLGYPVVVSGVVITIGFSELLMADACSGLWSLVSLITVGLLFLYFLPLPRGLRSLLFLVLILPIALTTNFLRLLLLVLLAYHFGLNTEAVAHDYAAIAELICSLALFSLAHRLLERPGRIKATPLQSAAA